MSIIKRLKNLWKLSGYEPQEPGETRLPGDIIAPLIKRNNKPAIIVDMHDPLSIDLGNE